MSIAMGKESPDFCLCPQAVAAFTWSALLHGYPCLAGGVGGGNAVVRGLVADDVIVNGAETLDAGDVKAGLERRA